MDKFSGLKLLLRPLLRYCIKKNISIQELIEISKKTLIKEAEEEILEQGDKINISRLAVITGLNRREIMRLQKENNSPKLIGSYVSRVIGQWENDPEFLNKKKQVRPLSIKAENNEFKKLLNKISKDINYGTVLFELERTKSIIRENDTIKLIKTSFTPIANYEESFNILSNDIQTLISTVEENVTHTLDIPNLHGRTEFDKIPVKDLTKIRKWILDKGSKFHQEVRKFLVQFDQDFQVNKTKEETAKVVVTAFSKIELVNSDNRGNND